MAVVSGSFSVFTVLGRYNFDTATQLNSILKEQEHFRLCVLTRYLLNVHNIYLDYFSIFLPQFLTLNFIFQLKRVKKKRKKNQKIKKKSQKIRKKKTKIKRKKKRKRQRIRKKLRKRKRVKKKKRKKKKNLKIKRKKKIKKKKRKQLKKIRNRVSLTTSNPLEVMSNCHPF